MKPVEIKNIGVIGLGSIGLRHASNLLAMGYDVLGFDPSEDRQKLLKEKGGKTAPKKDIFQNVDVIVIASPNHFHFNDLKDAIDHDCHAFVEKPLSHTKDGLPDLLLQSQKKNLTVSVGMNVRLNPAIHYLKNKIEKNDIGKILWGEYTFHAYLPDWRPDNDYRKGYAADPKTGGIVFDAVHGFDILYYLLGAYDVKACVAKNSGIVEIPSDDIADILCVHDSGVTSRLHMDYITKPKEHSVIIATELGFARVNISKRTYEWESRDGHKDIKTFNETTINDDYTRELDMFLKVALHNNPNHSPLEDALAVTDNVIKARSLAGLPF